MTIRNSKLDQYTKNADRRLDLNPTWYKSVNLTKVWLEKNISLVGSTSEENFSNVVTSLTKEVEIPEQVIYGTGVLVHDDASFFDNGDFSYNETSPVPIDKGTFSFTDNGQASGVTHSINISTESVALSSIHQNIVGFSGDGEYPNIIISCASPESIFNVLNYIENYPFDFGSASTILSQSSYSPVDGIVIQDKESFLNTVSPLNISTTEQW